MNCKEFEKNIPGFIEGKLNYTDLKEFVDHRARCAACREELDIQFLVMEGMHHLENGDNFDLQRELDRRLSEELKRLERHRRVLSIWVFLGIVITVAMIIILLWVFL